MIEMRNFSRRGEIEMPAWAADLGGRRLQPNELSIPFSPQVPARFASGFVLTVPVMDTTRYLDYLAGRLLDAGGSVTGDSFFDHLEEVDREFGLVINCSGIGARTLVPDSDLRASPRTSRARSKVGPSMRGCLRRSAAHVCDPAHQRLRFRWNERTVRQPRTRSRRNCSHRCRMQSRSEHRRARRNRRVRWSPSLSQRRRLS